MLSAEVFSLHATEFSNFYVLSDRQAWANSLDPDEMPQNAKSGSTLFDIFIQQFLDTTLDSKFYWFKF